MALRSLLFLALLHVCTPDQLGAQENKFALPESFFVDPNLHEAIAPRHGYRPLAESFPVKDIDSTVDVLSYELWFDWVMALQTARSERPERKAEARSKMMVRFVDGRPTWTMDARSVIIDSVFVDGVKAEFQKNTSTLVITPSIPFDDNDTAEVVIYFANASDTRGFYAYSQVEADTLNLLSPIAFTFSQPEDARRWFPCNDKPHDKAVFMVHVRVPNGYTVVSNGTRIDSVADVENTNWQTWHHPLPMPTYLVCVNASKYHRYDQEFQSADQRTIPIFNYHWLEDHDGTMYNALNALKNIPAMFMAFEAVYGAYPFDTYGHVTVAPIQYGGMEHQTMSTINRRWLQGDVELGYAHEIAHQWIGDLVTCATWADIWLNEGGASFSEAVWYGELYGEPGYYSVLNARRERYLRRGLDEPPIYDIPISIIFNEATTYSKSAWVYHMMRRMVGDDKFFPTLQRYFADYRLGAAQTADLLAVMKREIPNPVIDWDTYFDQWLVKAGHPVLIGIMVANTVAENGRYRTTIQLSQLQSGENIPSAFEFPLTIRVLNETEVFDTTFIVRNQRETFNFMAPFVADSLALDPNDNVLCQKTTMAFTSVSESEEVPSRYLGPNPIVRGTAAHFQIMEGASMHVTDLTGRTIERRVLRGSIAEIDTNAWPVGLIAVQISNQTYLIAVTE